MIRPASSKPSGDLPAALREWCAWIYLHADLAIKAAPRAMTPEGKPATWLDMCGQANERPLIEAAMRANIWRPAEEMAA